MKIKQFLQNRWFLGIVCRFGVKNWKYFFIRTLDWTRFGLYNFGLAGDCPTRNDSWLCLTLACDVWRLNRCHLANGQVVLNFEFALEFGFQRDEATNLHRSLFLFPPFFSTSLLHRSYNRFFIERHFCRISQIVKFDQSKCFSFSLLIQIRF